MPREPLDGAAGRPAGDAPRPARLRTGEDREASRLELFVDLALVLVVAELALGLSHDLGWHGAGVFAITWWSWATATLHADRLDTNDVLFRLLSAVGVLLVLVPLAGVLRQRGGAIRTAPM